MPAAKQMVCHEGQGGGYHEGTANPESVCSAPDQLPDLWKQDGRQHGDDLSRPFLETCSFAQLEQFQPVNQGSTGIQGPTIWLGCMSARPDVHAHHLGVAGNAHDASLPHMQLGLVNSSNLQRWAHTAGAIISHTSSILIRSMKGATTESLICSDP
jgi:hypothetical protein